MNIEQNDQVYEQPKKSGKGLFACGGIGCILMLLFCGGFVGLGAYIAMPVVSLIQEAQTLAAENPTVIAAIGEPITFDPPIQEGQNNETGEVEFRFPMKGANGGGNVFFKMKLEGMSFVKTEHRVELDSGEVIDLIGDDGGFNLDVDDGGGADAGGNFDEGSAGGESPE